MIGLTAAAAGGVVGTTAHAGVRRTGFERAAGVAVVGGAPKVLCLLDGSWVLAGVAGDVRPTEGLAGAVIADVTTDGSGALAVGSGAREEATVWRSADGVRWVEVLRLAGTKSEFTAVGQGLVLGSVLTGEGVPRSTVAARRQAGSWATVPTRGLDGEQSVTALTASAGGWRAASVGASGTTLFRSGDGSIWAKDGKLADTVVKGLLPDRWVGNSLGGTTARASKAVAVSRDAIAIGAAGNRSYWLVDGRLVTAGI